MLEKANLSFQNGHLRLFESKPSKMANLETQIGYLRLFEPKYFKMANLESYFTYFQNIFKGNCAGKCHIGEFSRCGDSLMHRSY